jgi:hypothetical protein
MFELRFTSSALTEFESIKSSPAKAGLLKQIRKTLGFLQANPRHPSLQTHEYHSIPHPYSDDEKVFEAYAQNQTPGAYRVFWCYGPLKKQITIIAITPHP